MTSSSSSSLIKFAKILVGVAIFVPLDGQSKVLDKIIDLI
jgi:hypothetical protein